MNVMGATLSAVGGRELFWDFASRNPGRLTVLGLILLGKLRGEDPAPPPPSPTDIAAQKAP